MLLFTNLWGLSLDNQVSKAGQFIWITWTYANNRGLAESCFLAPKHVFEAKLAFYSIVTIAELNLEADAIFMRRKESIF